MGWDSDVDRLSVGFPRNLLPFDLEEDDFISTDMTGKFPCLVAVIEIEGFALSGVTNGIHVTALIWFLGFFHMGHSLNGKDRRHKRPLCFGKLR